ncbi:MAG TPA: hypothetical protein VGL77_19780, partial [Armatimonadota bacterium]
DDPNVVYKAIQSITQRYDLKFVESAETLRRAMEAIIGMQARIAELSPPREFPDTIGDRLTDGPKLAVIHAARNVTSCANYPCEVTYADGHEVPTDRCYQYHRNLADAFHDLRAAVQTLFPDEGGMPDADELRAMQGVCDAAASYAGCETAYGAQYDVDLVDAVRALEDARKGHMGVSAL